MTARHHFGYLGLPLGKRLGPCVTHAKGRPSIGSLAQADFLDCDTDEENGMLPPAPSRLLLGYEPGRDPYKRLFLSQRTR
jgi:hypothetical protein